MGAQMVTPSPVPAAPARGKAPITGGPAGKTSPLDGLAVLTNGPTSVPFASVLALAGGGRGKTPPSKTPAGKAPAAKTRAAPQSSALGASLIAVVPQLPAAAALPRGKPSAQGEGPVRTAETAQSASATASLALPSERTGSASDGPSSAPVPQAGTIRSAQANQAPAPAMPGTTASAPAAKPPVSQRAAPVGTAQPAAGSLPAPQGGRSSATASPAPKTAGNAPAAKAASQATAAPSQSTPPAQALGVPTFAVRSAVWAGPVQETPASGSHPLAEMVLAHVHVLRTAGQTTFRAQLEPPHLGEVQVRLVAQDGGVSVQITVAHAQAQTALSAQLPQLRESLSQAGVNVQNLTLSLMSGGGEPHRGPPQEGRRSGRSAVLRLAVAVPAGSDPAAVSVPNGGMLNLVV